MLTYRIISYRTAAAAFIITITACAPTEHRWYLHAKCPCGVKTLKGISNYKSNGYYSATINQSIYAHKRNFNDHFAAKLNRCPLIFVFSLVLNLCIFSIQLEHF